MQFNPITEPLAFRTYTPLELAQFNGKDDPHILIAVKSKVFDVTSGGPYENFAGKDASRGLAKNSFQDENLRGSEDSIDPLDDLEKDELESLEEWLAHFENKYPLVGKLVEK